MPAFAVPPSIADLCALTSVQATEGRASSRLARAEIDWPEVAALAQRHRVECLLFRTVTRHDLVVPEPLRTRLAARAQRHSMRAMSATAAVGQLAAALDAEGVPFVLLKGDAVADRFYQHPADRQAIDVDILTAEQDVEDAVEALARIGFERPANWQFPEATERLVRRLNADVPLSRTSDEIRIELHWRLAKNPHLLPWKFREMHENSTPVTVAGRSVRVFQSAPLLVYLLVHGARHHWFRLKWLADIDRMLTKMTTEEVEHALAIGHAAGCGKMVGTSLELLKRLFGTPVDDYQTMATASDDVLLGRMLDAIAQPKVQQTYGLSNLRQLASDVAVDLRLRDGNSFRGAQIMGTLIDNRDLQAIGLSERWLWFYVLAAPFTKVWRTIRRASAPPPP